MQIIDESLAYVVADNTDKVQILHKNIRGELYDEIDILSEVNRKLVYQAKLNNREFIVMDNIPGKAYNGIQATCVVGNELAYIANTDHGMCVVFKGKEIWHHQKISNLTCIKGKLAFVITETNNGKKEHFIILDEKIIRKIQADEVYLSKSDNELLYTVLHSENREQLFVDDRPQSNIFYGIDCLLTINNKIFLVACVNADRQRVIFDDQKGPLYEEILDYFAVGNKLAYLARKSVTPSKVCFVLNNKAGKTYDKIGYFWERTSVNNQLAYEAEKNSIKRIVINETELPDSRGLLRSRLTSKAISYLKQTAPGKQTITILTSKPNYCINSEERELIKLLRLVTEKKLNSSQLKQIDQLLNKTELTFNLKGAAVALFKKFGLIKHKLGNYPDASRIFDNLFPELEAKRAQRFRGVEYGSFLKDDSSFSLRSGNPLSEKKQFQNLETNYQGMVATGIYGAYDFKSQTWQSLKTALAFEASSNDQIHDFSLNVEPGQEIILPKALGASLLIKSLQGASLISTDNNTLVRTNSQVLSYQICSNKIFNIGSNSNWEDYNKNLTLLKSEDRLLEDLAPEERELNQIVKSLVKKSPLATALTVQAYVRSNFHYDQFAEETNKTNDTLTPDKRIQAMQQRATKLLREGSLKIGNKKYSGICTDAAVLTCVLLRKAGLAASIVTAFDPQSMGGHSFAYILMPAKNTYGFVPVPVDGTPTGSIAPANYDHFDLSSIEEPLDVLTDKIFLSEQKKQLISELLNTINSSDAAQSHEAKILLKFIFAQHIATEIKEKLYNFLSYIIFSGAQQFTSSELLAESNLTLINPSSKIDLNTELEYFFQNPEHKTKVQDLLDKLGLKSQNFAAEFATALEIYLACD